jgi:hypothetical protein
MESIKRMNMEATFHDKAFLEIMKVFEKYNITDVCMGITSTFPESEKNAK